MPEPVTLQFDGRLTDVSIQYRNDDFIADQVVPPTPCNNKKGTYKKYDKDERFTIPETLAGPKGEPNEVEWKTTEDTFLCADHALQEFVSNEEIDNAEAPIQPLRDATEFVTQLLALKKEQDVAAAAYNANNYATANKIDIAGAWATLTTDVVKQIQDGIAACFARPNVLAMGIDTWNYFSRNEKLIAFIKGTIMAQGVKEDEVAKAFGLQKVLVGHSRYNTAKKGQAATFGRLWDGTNAGKGGAVLLRSAERPTTRDIVSFAHFHWKQRMAFTRDSARGAFGGKIVSVAESRVIKTVSTDVGYLFQDCLVT